MKSGFDMVVDVRSLINVPAITTLIDGKVYPNIRPDGSKAADIVVNSLGITNTQDQIGYGNINIYVPKVNQAGILVTDQARLYSLCELISPLVDAQYKLTFRTEVVNTGQIFKDTDGSYYANVKFKYYSLQDNYKNI